VGAFVRCKVPGKKIEHQIADGVELKWCGTCKEWLPLEAFSHDRSRRDGLHAQCRSCDASVSTAYRKTNMDAIHLRQQAWRDAHRNEERARQRVYRVSHSEEVSSRKRAWRRAHPEYTRAWAKAYYIAHKEEARTKNTAWAKANSDKIYIKRARRRARKLAAPGYDYTTAKLIKARWGYYGGLCWICGAPAEAVDHVKPLAKGGAHLPCNLRPACSKCNSTKGAKWPFSKEDLRMLL
jgi:5-methylcytosine-specific restriction endonuclease McrA